MTDERPGPQQPGEERDVEVGLAGPGFVVNWLVRLFVGLLVGLCARLFVCLLTY
jgi:hypothetical protein